MRRGYRRLTYPSRPGSVYVMVEPLSLFISLLINAAGKSAATEGLRVLRQVAGLQDAQMEMLRTIDVKVDALLQGPFRTGRRQLEDAVADSRSTDDREHLLREARASFTTALGQDDEPLRRSFAALHLAAVWLALDEPSDMRRALEEAHVEALRAVIAERERKPGTFNLLRVLGSQSQSERDNRQRALRAGAIVPYANDLARARAAWRSSYDIMVLVLPDNHHPIPVVYPSGTWPYLDCAPLPALSSVIDGDSLDERQQWDGTRRLLPHLIAPWLMAYDRGEVHRTEG